HAASRTAGAGPKYDRFWAAIRVVNSPHNGPPLRNCLDGPSINLGGLPIEQPTKFDLYTFQKESRKWTHSRFSVNQATCKKPRYRRNRSMIPALSFKNRLVAGVGVCDAVYREFLFGTRPCARGKFQSYLSCSVGRVCSRCYRKRSSDFVPSR